MLAKYAIRLCTQVRGPFYRFSNSRQLEADESNPVLEKRERKFTYMGLMWRIGWWTFTGLFCYQLYLNNYTAKPQDELGYVEFVNNAARKFQSIYQYYYDFMTKPCIDKLLPDVPNLGYGFNIPKTLVLNLSGTLVHMDYVFGKGGELKLREGLKVFLRQLSQYYEVVVLTDDDTMYTQSICQKLDPAGNIFAGRFGRESLVLERGKYVKDLKYLNRPLSKVVVLETSPERIENYWENCVFITPFDGKTSDSVLNDTLKFLIHLSSPNVKDVRAELKKFGNYDPQLKFLEEVKQRESRIKDNMKGGLMGLISNKPKNPHFDNRRI